MMKTIIVILMLSSITITAQDLTGVWTGYIRTPGSQLEYELAISSGDRRLTGYSLIIYPKDGIENVGIKTAKLRQGKKEILFEDGELVYDNFTTQSRRVKMFGNLFLTTKDTLMILQGNFNTRSLDFRDTRTYSGEVYLEKTNKPLTSKMLTTLDEINLPYNLSFARYKKKKPVRTPALKNPKKISTVAGQVAKPDLINSRQVQKISEIAFSTDSLQLSLYDNGTVDGDTVSVVLNGRVIGEKIKLTTSAYRITVPANISSGDSLTLIMHAESLGLIPPNTGLLIIQDGATRHEIRFEGDLQRSSAIVLRRKR